VFAHTTKHLIRYQVISTTSILGLAIGIFFIGTPETFAASKTIQGKIIDAETGQGLGQAFVRINNTHSGSLANNEGHFKMTLWQLPTTLAITHVGHHTERIVVSESSDDTFLIKLTNRSYSLP